MTPAPELLSTYKLHLQSAKNCLAWMEAAVENCSIGEDRRFALSIVPHDDTPDGPMPNALLLSYFSPAEREIIRVLADGPCKQATLARRLGAITHENVATKFKLQLANLVDRGILTVGDDGYQIVDDLVPILRSHFDHLFPD